MKTLTIIGCGNVGKTLGKLLVLNRLVEVQQVMNRSTTSSQAAIEFLGQGKVSRSFKDLKPSDLYLISTSDDAIAACAEQLSELSAVPEGSIIFHCSGSQPSNILSKLRDRGANICSIHPVKSFANPLMSLASFAGTYCGVEGDEIAVAILKELIEKCGAFTFAVNPEFKLLYHAGTVIVCNYFTALLETGLRCYEKAGIDRTTAMLLLRPIVEGTIANNFALGPSMALTGPIARGDVELVVKQDEAIADWDKLISKVYRTMGLVAVELSSQQGNAQKKSLERISSLLAR